MHVIYRQYLSLLLVTALCLGSLVLHSRPVFAQVWIDGFRVWHSSRKTRLVLDLSQLPVYEIFQLDQPNRLVVDVQAADLRVDPDQTDFKDSLLRGIRSGRRQDKVLRLVLDLKQSVSFKHFTLEPNQQYGHRLVLDLKPNGVQQEPVVIKRPAVVPKVRNLMVVLDPGHGGEDPGAIGRGGLREKIVVLQIARALERRLKRERGISAVLTRTGDYYVGLRQRRAMSRDQYQADLFVSIHADAWKEPKAQGASVFVLSRRGASSALARYLAKSANESDRIGGVEIGQQGDVLRTVLADLALEGSLEHSFRVGGFMLEELNKVAYLHKKTVGSAAFMVLKTVDVPSILVETGFISNPREERLLSSASYQRRLADALGDAIVRYFRAYPPPNTWFAQWYEASYRQHRIAHGETLSDIAQKYRIKLQVLKDFNALRSDRIQVGQTLRIPNT